MKLEGKDPNDDKNITVHLRDVQLFWMSMILGAGFALGKHLIDVLPVLISK